MQNLNGSVTEWVLCAEPGQKCILDANQEDLGTAIVLIILSDSSGVYAAIFYGQPRSLPEVNVSVNVVTKLEGKQQVEGKWSSNAESRMLLVGPMVQGIYCFKHTYIIAFDNIRLFIGNSSVASLALSAEEILSNALCIKV